MVNWADLAGNDEVDDNDLFDNRNYGGVRGFFDTFRDMNPKIQGALGSFVLAAGCGVGWISASIDHSAAVDEYKLEPFGVEAIDLKRGVQSNVEDAQKKLTYSETDSCDDDGNCTTYYSYSKPIEAINLIASARKKIRKNLDDAVLNSEELDQFQQANLATIRDDASRYFLDISNSLPQEIKGHRTFHAQKDGLDVGYKIVLDAVKLLEEEMDQDVIKAEEDTYASMCFWGGAAGVFGTIGLAFLGIRRYEN
jgi:hypothetical protein